MYSIEEALGMAIVPLKKKQSCASLLEIQSKLLTKFDNSQHQLMVEKPINYLEHRYCSERINLRDWSSILAKAWPVEEEEFVMIGLVEFSVEAIDELRALIPC